jgi:chemotaxis protein CheZ
LLDVSSPNQRKELLENGLAGPVINSAGRDDVVANQTQVDDLLESLGF